jgi:predicted methyltransferase
MNASRSGPAALLGVLLAAAAFAPLATAAAAAPADAGAPAGTPASAPLPPYVVPADAPDYIREAIEDPTRPLEQRARDVNRKPAELLMLSGIKPGERVVEFASFGQYFTAFLSDIVGAHGRVYMYDLPYTDKFAGAASRAFVAAHLNCEYQQVDYNTLQLPEHVDVVYMVLYYHDLFINHIDPASLNDRIFKALKPGGIFLVVDHNALPGSGTLYAYKLHRIDPDVIQRQVTAAGFELVTRSPLLAHSQDDHTQIVFAPGLRGLTDQTVFEFRKPRG